MFARLVKQWLLPVLLAVVALVAWQTANRADFDKVGGEAVAYERTLDTPVLSARRLPRTLRAPVNDALIAPSINNISFQSPRDQTCLIVRNQDRVLGEPLVVPGGLVPASNQKLLTTYTALGVLGPDFVFTTRVSGSAPVLDGVLDGDLYLIGDGDPFLVTADWMSQYEATDGRFHTSLEALADRVAATGLTQVTGAVIGDESRYDDVRYGPWAERLINPQKQSGPLSALTVNEGFVQWPEVFPNTFRTRSETNDPPVHGASVFEQLLRERGIGIGSRATSGVAPDSATELATVSSPRLVDLVTHVNSYSSNMGAELLLKRIGLQQTGRGTTEAGAAAMTQYLTEQGIPMDGVMIFDGSGLAETNRLTCSAIAAILVANDPDSDFGSSLSIAGERGSLLMRFVDTPADGRVLAKTGTLRRVLALSGYVLSASAPEEERYVSFAYIINDDVIQEDIVERLQQPLVSALTRYPQGPTVEQLSPLPAKPS